MEQAEYQPGVRAAVDELQIQAELPAGYEKLSEIQYRDGGAHLGDSAGALASVGKAVGLRQALAAGRPDRAARRALAADYSRLAQIRSLTRDLAGAARDSRQALALQEALWREAPGDADGKAELARALTDLGEIERRRAMRTRPCRSWSARSPSRGR
jgi:hypothetical protein